MRTIVFVLFLISSACFAQSDLQFRDSIIKYKNINPNKAIAFGLDYVASVQNKESDSLVVGTYAMIGDILSNSGLDASAITFFDNALRLYESMPDENKRDPNAEQPPWVLVNIGNIYLRNGEYGKAKEKYNKALSIFETIDNKKNAFYGINTSASNLGLIDESLGNFDEAEEKYISIYRRRLEENKPEDVLYSLSQLITINLLKGSTLSASNYFDQAKLYYDKHEKDHATNLLFKRNFGYCFLSFGAYHQSKKAYNKAIQRFNEAKIYLEDLPTEIAALGSRFAECYYGLGQLDEAERIALNNLSINNLSEREKRYNYKVLEKIYRKSESQTELLKIKDSLLIISAGGSAQKILSTLNNLEAQIQLAKSARELNESKIKYNTYLYILIVCTVILFFSLLTIRINYNYHKERSTRLALEKEAIENELDKKNRELVSKSNFIIQRNDYLKKIQKQIDSDQDNEVSKSRLIKELEMTINSEKTYQDFDKVFVEVYPEFYTNLNKLAKLSKTDLRLASYIKMNHSNDEIARISGVSIRTIESQRYRLSKKLALTDGENLNSFILAI